MKEFLTSFREGWSKPPPRGTRRVGAMLGLIIG